MSDLLSSISVLLVFLTFLFNGIEKEINEILQETEPPKAQLKAFEHYKAKVLRLLLLKSVPVSLIYTVVFYSLLPKAFYILSTSEFSKWDFDALNTIFIFIEIGLFGLLIYTIIKACELIIKYYKLQFNK